MNYQLSVLHPLNRSHSSYLPAAITALHTSVSAHAHAHMNRSLWVDTVLRSVSFSRRRVVGCLVKVVSSSLVCLGTRTETGRFDSLYSEQVRSSVGYTYSYIEQTIFMIVS